MSEKTDDDYAWVIWHKYGDGSGAHIERVYITEERAKEDFDLLVGGPEPSTKSTSNEWFLTKVDLVGEY